MRSLLLALMFFAALFAATAPANAKTEVRRTGTGTVAFPDGSKVAIQTSGGEIDIGTYVGRNDWITAILDAKGKVLAKVGKGGDIVLISPQVYARRDPGKATYVIERLDKKAKPVKTPFVEIYTRVDRFLYNVRGWGAIGITKLSDVPHNGLGKLERSYNVGGPAQIDMFADIQAISREGVIGPAYKDVAAVHAYGDFFILTYQGGVAQQVVDLDINPLSPVGPELIGALLPDDDPEFEKIPLEYPRIMFVVRRGKLGNGETLYRFLPRKITDNYPPEFLGVVPLQRGGSDTNACGHFRLQSVLSVGEDVSNCLQNIYGWIGIWAGEDGPEMTLLNYDGTPADDRRYQYITSVWAFRTDMPLLVEKDGSARLAALQYREVDAGYIPVVPSFTFLPDRFASANAAYAYVKAKGEGIRQAVEEENRRYNEKLAAEAALREAQYKAQAELRAREEAELAALTQEENARARELMVLDASQWQEVCNASMTTVTYYARLALEGRCSELRPRPEPVKLGFWDQLASALDAWAGAAAAQGYSGGGSAGSGGVSPDWDYARAMRNIDNSITTITDPNWNGAASRASR